MVTLILMAIISCKKDEEPADDSSVLPGVFTSSGIKSTASIGDTLKISGENFPSAGGGFEVYFNEQKANVISQDSKNVVFIVPLFDSDSCKVYLKDGKGRVIKEQSFKLEPVKIVSTLSKVKSGEILTIYGKNFQRLNNIQVTVNDKAISSGLSVNAAGLSFKMPDTLYPGRKPIIAVSSGTAARLSTTTTVSDKWVRVAYSPFVFRGLFASFVYKDEGYVLSHDKEGTDKKAFLYKLNPHTYKWTTQEVPVTATGAVATAEDIYYITEREHIYKVGVDSVRDSYLSTLPDASNKNNQFVAIGSNIYAFVGEGLPFTTSLSNTFYKLDVATKTWSRMEDFPETSHRYLKLAVDGNKLYAIVGYTRFYVYDAITNKWEKKPFTINPAANYVNAFYAQRGKVYTLISSGGSETIYEYDPGINSWTSLGKLREEGSNNFYGFFIGNKHFIGGHKHDPWSTELFESDASYLLE